MTQTSTLLTNALDTLTTATRRASLYPTLETMKSYTATPALLTDDLHREMCSGTWLTFADERDELQSYPCPRCATERNERKLREQLISSGVDGRYLDSEWTEMDLPVPIDRMAAACENIGQIITQGASLLLYSNGTGSGKTQAAMLAAKATIRAGYTAHVGNLARLAVDVRHGYNVKDGTGFTEKAALTRLTSPDLLVIDDLGAGETDTAAVERRLLFLALDERQMRLRPTIVTTNLTPADLAKTLGARVLARLQPLTVLHFDHGVNFRTRDTAKGLW